MPKSLYPGNKFEQMRHRSFTRSRCQAHFRGEVWELTLEEWRLLWTPERWSQRGKATDSLCMTRIDPTQPWNKVNACVVTRVNHLQMKAIFKYGGDITPHLQGAHRICQ